MGRGSTPYKAQDVPTTKNSPASNSVVPRWRNTPYIFTNFPVSLHSIIRNKGKAIRRTEFLNKRRLTFKSPRLLTLHVPESSASRKQAFLTKVPKANGKGSRKRSRSTASLHSHPQTHAPRSRESKAEKNLSREQAATPAPPARAAAREGEARPVHKGAALGPPPPPTAPLGPRRCVPVPKPHCQGA